MVQLLSSISLSLTIAVGAMLSPGAMAGAWEYQAPFRYIPPNGSPISAPAGASVQLFNRNKGPDPIPYVYQPNYQQQNSANSWMPMAMIGLALLPMIMKDEPTGNTNSSATKSKYQLTKNTVASDLPTHSKTDRRSPASIPLRKRYIQAADSPLGSGTR